MTQRNPMNDRYTEENRTGKTRKSSASAKPKAERAATVREPAPKTKEQKKKERKERERKEAEKAQALNGRYEQTEGYKTLRRFWWGCLIGAIVLTAVSFYLTNQEGMQSVSMVAMVIAYALIIPLDYVAECFRHILRMRRVSVGRIIRELMMCCDPLALVVDLDR